MGAPQYPPPSSDTTSGATTLKTHTWFFKKQKHTLKSSQGSPKNYQEKNKNTFHAGK